MLTSVDPLVFPVRSALASRLHAFTIGTGQARRMLPDYGDFASLDGNGPEAWTQLAGLMEIGEEMVLVGPEMARPHGSALRLKMCGFGYLLVLDTPLQRMSDLEVERLGDDDVVEMTTLRGLPEHGILPPLRHRMGRFVGVRHCGVLVAMAGENLNLDGYTEIAGVFTRRDERRRRLGEALIRDVATAVQSRGDRPFAMVTVTNMPALRLFHRLGFRLHCELVFSQIGKVSELHVQDIPPAR